MRSVYILLLELIFFAAGCNLREPKFSLVFSPMKTFTHISSVSLLECYPENYYYGAVTGHLFLINGQPAVGSIVYLGDYAGIETSNPLIILDPVRNPRTQTVEGGKFCFSGVLPGRYGLIVWDAAESILLTDPRTGYSLLVDVKPGEITNVGILYSSIP